MHKKYFQIWSFLLLLIIATPFESGFAIQNPGWKTIIPSTSYLEIIVWFLVLTIVLTYWLIIKKKPINSSIFFVHFLLSIPLVLYARFNMFIRSITATNSNDILEFINLLNTIAYSVLILFLISQIIFIVYIIKIKR